MKLDTHDFIDRLIGEGYTHLCVVPCSFAKNLINAAINNERIEYVPCASEAVACSVAAGLKMAGLRPIVIVQSSGLTNMGSCITSLLKPYDIKFPMLVSWRAYNEGDSEIQHQHLATALPQLIAAYGYDQVILSRDSVDRAMSEINLSSISRTICIIEKDTFSKVDLEEKHQLDLSTFVRRSEYLKCLNQIFKGSKTLFIGTTGNTAREMYSFMPETNNFYMAGNMGGALSLGLGAAMAGKKVVVCGGDAEFVMHMGGLTTAGRYADDLDLTYILFDNESNKSTGGQKTYQSHINYVKIAQHTNISATPNVISNVSEFLKIMEGVRKKPSFKFLHVKCSHDEETVRPPIDDVKVTQFR